MPLRRYQLCLRLVHMRDTVGQKDTNRESYAMVTREVKENNGKYHLTTQVDELLTG